ncbi:hypothetical protein FOA52_003533 [Chlamydomonas sp. UWO 241]|nr:hypothetical protein FOA52_003533 [Chlamydomonas sp. UWO 241]
MFWNIAKQYQLWHAGALVAMAGLPPSVAVPAGTLFATGVALFSGSIYAFVLTQHKAFQYMTPFGGFAFIGGWGVVAVWYLTRAASGGPLPAPPPPSGKMQP